MGILDELAAHAKERVAEQSRQCSLSDMRTLAEDLAAAERRRAEDLLFPFERALKAPGLSFICEVKKASPSKGVIAESFPYLQIAKSYDEAGASAISVLTEPRWFLGSDEYLREIADAVSVPILRKDFTVDEYQIYQAKALGASAVLLICSILDDSQLSEFRCIAGELGLSALVEAHDESEVERALDCGAEIIGVNNRDLRDFSVSFDNAGRLRSLIPQDAIYVAESGVKGASDVRQIASMGADVVLVGEALMRSQDVALTLREFKQAALDAAKTKVKFCGLCQMEDVEHFNETLPEYAGFVFWEGSSRKVSAAYARKLREALDVRIKSVGVFVDARPSLIASLAKDGVISIAQLHGGEDDSYIQTLRELAPGMEIWQALIVNDISDVARANASSADMVLLDASRGGGRPFDWSLLEGVMRPFVLAGGLQAENVEEAIRLCHPLAVDVSSGIEMPGKAPNGLRRKDPAKMRQFIQSVRDSSKGAV